MKNKEFKELTSLVNSRRFFERTHFFQPFSEHRTNEDFYDIHGQSLIHYAIEMNNLEEVKKLVKGGIKINQRSRKSGLSPIAIALSNGHIDIVQYLFDQGADCSLLNGELCSTPESRIWFKNAVGQALKESFPLGHELVLEKTNQFFSFSRVNYLERAVEIGDIDFMKYAVVKNKYIFNYALTGPKSLLFTAAANGQLQVIKFLISEGAIVDNTDSYQKSALAVAVSNGQKEVADYLLAKGANINYQSLSKYTALMIAVMIKNLALVEMLLVNDADLSLQNTGGNNVLHLAAEACDANILKKLITNQKAKIIVTIKNIYGQTPLDIALAKKNLEIIELLLGLCLQEKNQTIAIEEINISQRAVMARMLYYLVSQYRDTTFFNHDGHCNGLEYLFQYYSAREMDEYFFDTLRLMASWDGSEEQLDKPFSHMPQQKYYKNLRELFEQWINDITWFQHDTFKSMLTQTDRLEQTQLVSEDPGDRPIFTYDYNTELTIEQLKEHLFYFSKLPPGMRLEIVGEQHATGFYINKNREIVYYDPNIKLQLAPIANTDELLKIIVDTKYIAPNISLRSKINEWLRLFYFERDKKNIVIPQSIFTEAELPQNKEEAKYFQDKSANRFTYLHVAVLLRDSITFKKLLHNNFCDVNACDSHGRTALLFIVSHHFEEALEILEDPIIHLMDSYEAVIAYQNGFSKALELILTHPKAKSLNKLLIAAIKNNDLNLVEHLVKNNLCDINQKVAGSLPLLEAIYIENDAIINFLLKSNADILQSCDSETPLAQVVRTRKQYYSLLLSYLKNINQLDTFGKAAIHYAIFYREIEILTDIVTKGGDIHLETSDKQKPLGMLLDHTSFYKSSLEVEKLMEFVDQHYTKDDFEPYQHILSSLLFYSIKRSDEKLFNFIISKCHRKTLDQTSESHEGRSPLHIAVLNDNYEYVEKLIQAGANVDIQTADGGNTCMHAFIMKNYDKKYINLFLDHHASMDILNKNNQTPNDTLATANEEMKNIFSEYYRNFLIPAQSSLTLS